MKRLTITSIVGFALLTFMVSSCGDNSSDPKPKSGNNDPVPIEGTYVGTWELPNENMPNDNLKQNYEKLVLIVGEDDSYEWTYYRKDGNKTVFTGITTQQRTNHKHSSGSAIWSYSIWVSEINGKSAPGGWDGLFTFENANKLIINVEPRVDGWSKWPTPENGVGSGQNGQESVYLFNKK